MTQKVNIENLLELLREEGEDIEREFKKASLKGKGTPQEVAEYREAAVQQFLGKYYPFPYRIAKGGVIDTFGAKSASMDCVVCNPIHPNTIEPSGKHSLLLADGVDSVVEVKPDIQKKDELNRGLEQIRTVKRLRRAESPRLMKKQLPDKVVEFSKQIPAIVFATKAKANLLDTANEILAYYVDEHVPLDEQVDIVVVHKEGIIANYKMPELNPWIPGDGGLLPQHGYFIEDWKVDTLAAMLLHMERFDGAAPRISSAVMTRYLKGQSPPNIRRLNFEGFWGE